MLSRDEGSIAMVERSSDKPGPAIVKIDCTKLSSPENSSVAMKSGTGPESGNSEAKAASLRESHEEKFKSRPTRPPEPMVGDKKPFVTVVPAINGGSVDELAGISTSSTSATSLDASCTAFPLRRLSRFFSPIQLVRGFIQDQYRVRQGCIRYLRCASTLSTRFLSAASSSMFGTSNGGGCL